MTDETELSRVTVGEFVVLAASVNTARGSAPSFRSCTSSWESSNVVEGPPRASTSRWRPLERLSRFSPVIETTGATLYASTSGGSSRLVGLPLAPFTCVSSTVWTSVPSPKSIVGTSPAASKISPMVSSHPASAVLPAAASTARYLRRPNRSGTDSRSPSAPRSSRPVFPLMIAPMRRLPRRSGRRGTLPR
jgi:hypothetical protein